jgi:hypothetical protein
LNRTHRTSHWFDINQTKEKLNGKLYKDNKGPSLTQYDKQESNLDEFIEKKIEISW